MPNSKAKRRRIERPGLGDVVEFNSDHWGGPVFGAINAIYVDLKGNPAEYWVANIDYADFKPEQLIGIVRKDGWKMPELPKPKFPIGERALTFDGNTAYLVIIKSMLCRVDEKGCGWIYTMEEKDGIGNPLPWGEEIDEENLKPFRV